MGYRKNHVTSTCYLGRWAGPDGRVRVINLPAIESEPAKPRSVGYRVDFWGRDPEVRRAVEEGLGRVESDVARTLGKLGGSWPFERGTTEWFALAYLVAIHLLRTPYAQQRMLAFQEAALRRQLPRFPHWDDDDVTQFVGTVTSDAWRAELFGEQLPQAASLIASMHWTLLEFSDEVLATSDQPVTVVPLLGDESIAPLAPFPSTGLADCEEIRMALDPRHALIMTWLNQPDSYPRLKGNDRLAAELNRAVIGQADEQWFHHPARRPTTFSPPLVPEPACGPIGRQLFTGYGYEVIVRSQRRVDTLRNLQQMIEEPAPGELRVAGVRPRAA